MTMTIPDSWRRPGLIGAAAVATLVIFMVATPHEAPVGTVLYGVIYGSLNGLLAIGLVLTYRLTRAINFAYGAMGGVGAAAGASLFLGHHWPWPAAVAVALAIGAVVGGGVGLLVNWRFSEAPRMMLTVATIGLAQLLGGIAFLEPRWLHGPTLITSFRTDLSSFHFEVNPVVFTGNEVVVIVTVPIVVALVSWFLLGTDAGRAVRAIADNAPRVRLLGIPARRLLLLVWIMSGVIAAGAVILQAPSAGVPIDVAAGPELLLAPLAAAVVARMESLWVAFVAAIGLGVMEEVVRLDVAKQSIETPIFLGVVLVALLVQHRARSRAEAADDSSWTASGTAKAIPKVLRSLPEVRALKVVGIVVLGALALSLPALLQPSNLDEVSVGIVFGLGALSLVVLSGWGGTISLGQWALVGVGAVAAGNLIMHTNTDLFLSLGAAGLAGALIAVVLGLPALRVKGMYLAVTTMAFAVAANDFFFNPTNFPRFLPSAVLRPQVWKRFDLRHEGDLYFLCLGVLVVTVVLVRGIRQARAGRAVIATRDNLRAAEAAGVPSTRVRLGAFAMAGLIAGVAGGLYVVILGSVGYQTFPPSDSILVFSMAVIGGLGSMSGALCGVALIEWLGIAFPNEQLLLTGIGMLVVLMVFPTGLAGAFEKVRDVVLVRIARRHGIDTSVWAGDDAALDESEVAPDARVVTLATPAATHADADTDILLRCQGVNAAYGSLQVLFGIDLAVQRGEMVALLGTNGAGKSSLLKTITGLLPASSGTVTFDGEVITADQTERIARRGLTMMPGGRGVFPSLSVHENLRVASWPIRHDRDEAEAARQRALELFPVLVERSDVAAGNLSGGEQQMLSLAMAFLVRPQLLCIDELSLGLAPTVVARLVDAVREIHQAGTTVLIVEQSVNVALLVAEKATFLEKGTVRFSGASADLLERPDLLRAVFIGGDHAVTSAEPTVDATPVPAVPIPATPLRAGEVRPVLECHGLTKHFGGITAVDGVDLVVQPHEVVGLIGHNGAGKTTLFDVISGFLEPDGGQLFIDGRNVTELAPHRRAVAGLGRSFQEARLYPSLTVAETITVALEQHLASKEPLAAALRLPASTDAEAAAAALVDELISQLGLESYRGRPIGELSTGTRRIVELACVMAQRPSVLLLDEPSGGVAQAETEALGPLLRQVARDTDCALLVIEHDMTLMSGLCDRLVALELGAVIAEGDPATVLADDRVIASYLGTDEHTVHRSGARPSALSASGPEPLPV
ncbi:MAG TPA: ATP-binding cassette domain-containing protein [Acidimicrobiales bacterium]|jgi:ABC-type branched-subunit amino acid transport system ATPase component/ABC-type branched-subunit amino acid transport system permease subunit|nr:ATP-binding cassette domain-containing protein [Acidimicrobiales bacterium]